MLALGLWLRWRFIQTVNLYPDEFVTLLAVQMIGERGLPVMPSGLFYEHGILFSYLGSLVAMLGPAWLAVRYASLLCGGLTLLLTFWLGRRWFSPAVGLIATTGLAVAPTAIHWSGRARMYALLQLLVLLTLWLAFEGIVQNKTYLRWLALLAYLGATLAHFVAVALAPPLMLGAAVLWWLRFRAREQRSKGAGEIPPSPSYSHMRQLNQSKTYPVATRPPSIPPSRGEVSPSLSQGEVGRGSNAAKIQPQSLKSTRVSPPTPLLLAKRWPVWLELIAFGIIIIIAFLVKRAGQPKGIDALDGDAGQAVTGLVEVFTIYSDFSFNLLDGWQAIAPFYLTLPALIFTPFALVAIATSLVSIYKLRFSPASVNEDVSALSETTSPCPSAIFLSLILLTTTLEMILLVSPDRRDDKYQFMLLPVLLLLGAWGMAVVGKWLLVISNWLVQSLNYQLPIPVLSQAEGTNYWRQISNLLPILISTLIIFSTWSAAQALLNNTGDDYDTAFAYVQEHWQEGDTILTGTPTAAALFLGRNDFYSVQRRGGYDYRILTVNDQLVDRWLASPAIRAEAALHRTLAENNVWLVLERWGLQREYYDLPFQQQLLAQTDYVTEAQGIFVLRSKANPKPIALDPAQPVEVNFANLVQLTGYTVEPDQVVAGQPLRLTLYWQALAPMPHNYTIFVHLRNAAGGNVAQADHRPLGNMYPTTLWPIGETIRESSDLFLPSDLPPGYYELWAGLYLLETGERLPLQNDAGGENAVQLGVLSVGQ